MAICINIKKYKKIENIHIYHVTTQDRGGSDFYIKLSESDKTISMYDNAKLENLLGILNLNNPDEKISVPELDSMILGCAIIKCLQAFRNNNFPDSMGYYA